MHRTKLLLGAMRHLKNWRHIRQMAHRARRGEAITESPVLQFRNGLLINMVPASYAGWDFLFEEIFLDRCYQPTPDFVPRQGWTIVDLGANMGFFTCQAASAAADVRVVSVEPLPPYQAVLKRNVQDNRLTQVKVVEGAICGEPDQIIPLTVWYNAKGELKTGEIPPDAAKVETMQAKGYTLQEVFTLGKVERCDLLKVDIEGAEYGLFEKIPAELWAKIQRVVMEVHIDETHSEKQIVQILEKNNFKIHVEQESPSISLLWATKK